MYGGDDRYYQNIFVGGRTPDVVGTAVFDGHTTSLEEFIDIVDAQQPCDHREFHLTKQPVYIADNVYTNGAKAFEKETEKLDKPDFDANFYLEEKDGKVYLNITMPEGFESFKSSSHNTKTLGRARIVDADFEDFDGGYLELDSDYLDELAEEKTVSGPLACLKTGVNRICVAE
jgi:hypothetical protein